MWQDRLFKKPLFALVLVTLLCYASAAPAFSFLNVTPYSGQTVWSDMASHFSLDHHTDNEDVRGQILWLQRHKIYITRMLQNAAPYVYYVFQQAKENNLPAELAVVPIVESAFDPYARSDKGAVGLWQINAITAKTLHVPVTATYDARRDIVVSTKAALDYLKSLHDTFNNDWLLAFAAYNSGPGTVDEAIKKSGKNNFFDLKLPQQTRDYVPKILALAAVIQNPDKYEIKLPPIPDQPYLQSVEVGPETKVATTAEKAGISIKLMQKLNPGFSYLKTAIAGHHVLLVPAQQAAEFTKASPPAPAAASSSQAVTGIVANNNSTAAASNNTNFFQLLSSAVFDGLARMVSNKNNAAAPANSVNPNANATTANNTTPTTSTAITSPITATANTANNPHINNNPPQTNSTTYQVRPTDTLAAIAQRYHLSVDALKSANNLTGNQIHVGQTLTIPIASASAEANKPPELILHKLKRGETLGMLAKKYKVTVEQLKTWNEIEDHRALREGQEIKIYSN